MVTSGQFVERVTMVVDQQAGVGTETRVLPPTGKCPLHRLHSLRKQQELAVYASLAAVALDG